MKQNTKFLWMYICILFSFAVILIIFAGLSSNNETEQEKSMERDITVLSKKNYELNNQNAELQKQLSQKQADIDALNQEKETFVAENKVYDLNESLLVQAIAEHENGNYTKCKEFINQIDSSTLTQSQMYVYERLTQN
ncbi:MAG: hypothetical protein II998_01705 [Clostridia bacterium]|nr:hypothetical protein [Clostridia bacterium]